MKQFTGVKDIDNLQTLIQEALELKKNPLAFAEAGKHKTLGLIFMNPSLRTRISTQKAGLNLGMHVIVMNMDKEGWALEFQDGAIMNGTTVEHIRDAAAVLGEYCDMIGLRCFPELKNKEDDYSEHILKKFISYCKKPIISLESATLHPLQSFADVITIEEHKKTNKPKVVLTWAPHVKALPQAVSNSFAEWMNASHVDFYITHPEGYELANEFSGKAKIIYNQEEALQDADFVYVKNWSSYKEYGKILCEDASWLLTEEKWKLTKEAKVMHCLPVRRNVELSDEILDSPYSLVQQQAANRVFAAQTILKRMLENKN